MNIRIILFKNNLINIQINKLKNTTIIVFIEQNKEKVPVYTLALVSTS